MTRFANQHEPVRDDEREFVVRENSFVRFVVVLREFVDKADELVVVDVGLIDRVGHLADRRDVDQLRERRDRREADHPVARGVVFVRDQLIVIAERPEGGVGVDVIRHVLSLFVVVVFARYRAF